VGPFSLNLSEDAYVPTYLRIYSSSTSSVSAHSATEALVVRSSLSRTSPGADGGVETALRLLVAGESGELSQVESQLAERRGVTVRAP
jgi:hypothetical protein